MPHPHFISFVIPAWNEESVLGPTLEAVSIATRHLAVPSEVIVANDSSSDRTAEIASQHGAQVVPVHHRQISATRNAGARAAQGDSLIFIDADTIVTLGAAAPFATADAFRLISEFSCPLKFGLPG